MAEKEIGKIIHFYPKIGVAVIELKDSLKVGDNIIIKTKDGEVRQTVDSMQIEHKNIDEAKKGQSIGLKVAEAVKEGNVVCKE